jgi:hypothetical protein
MPLLKIFTASMAQYKARYPMRHEEYLKTGSPYFIFETASMHHNNSSMHLPVLLSVASLSAGVPSSW